MDFRCANRRRKRRLHLAAVEPYLGDIIGTMPAPMRPVYLRQIDARCRVQSGVHVILATLGAGGMILLISIPLVTLFAFSGH